MKIGGWQKVSLIDYPGEVSTVIFTVGCNMRCPYCHNPELVKEHNFHGKYINEKTIIDFIKKKNKKHDFIDGIVICGGEPTEQIDLIKFCKIMKRELGIKVKLDTNGSNPKILKQLNRQKLVDYLAMDVKVGQLNNKNYLESVNYAKRFPDYEFRLTVVPKMIHAYNIKRFMKPFKKAKKMYLQRFYKRKGLLSNLFNKVKDYSDDELNMLCSLVSKYFQKCEVRR